MGQILSADNLHTLLRSQELKDLNRSCKVDIIITYLSWDPFLCNMRDENGDYPVHIAIANPHISRI